MEKKENTQREREREERFSLFASNYHNNLQVYLNFPASNVQGDRERNPWLAKMTFHKHLR